jgi:DNA-binding HxlR family transcriptional regulator
MDKFKKRYGISSKLQEVILSYICTNKDVTYDILAKICNRNERTIGKSVRTLEEKFYLERELTRERKNRSNYVITPTLMGMYYGLAYLNLDYRDYLKAHGDENDQSQFSEFLQKIEDYNEWFDYNRYN